MLHTFIGIQNSGKTLLMTYFGFMDWLKGRTIFSNYDVSFPHTKINKDFIIYIVENGIKLENVTFLLDEFWMWIDSRASITNRVMSYFYLQTSKDNNNVYTSAQGNNQNDVRFRDNLHKITSCSRKILVNNSLQLINSEVRILPKHIQEKLYICGEMYKLGQSGLIVDFEYDKTVNIKADLIFDLFDTTQKIKVQV